MNYFSLLAIPVLCALRKRTWCCNWRPSRGKSAICLLCNLFTLFVSSEREHVAATGDPQEGNQRFPQRQGHRPQGLGPTPGKLRGPGQLQQALGLAVPAGRWLQHAEVGFFFLFFFFCAEVGKYFFFVQRLENIYIYLFFYFFVQRLENIFFFFFFWGLCFIEASNDLFSNKDVEWLYFYPLSCC